MTADPSGVLRITRRFNASAERIFDAWIVPETASKWLFATATGTMVRAETDPRVGGRFTFVDRRDGEDIEHVGEYLEVDRPRRLVFTFAVPRFSDVYTRLTIDIVPLDAGCELTLTHEGVLPEWQGRTQAGWTMLLGNLAEAVSPGAADYGQVIAADTLRFVRSLPGPIERVWSYLADSDRRAQWLGAGEIEPRVGAEVTLHFQHADLSPHHVPPPEKYQELATGKSTKNRVTVFEPPHRLGLTWSDGPDSSDVLFELVPQGDRVQLTVTHRRLVNRDTLLGVAAGWHTHLVMLSDRISDRAPPPFWVLFAEFSRQYEKRLGDGSGPA